MNAINEQTQKTINTFFQTVSDANAMTKESMEALFQSISIATKGCSEIYDSVNTLTQKTIDQSAKTCLSMLSTTSVNDLVSAQSSSLKNNFEEMLSDLGNISQISSRVLQQAAEPVAKNVNDSWTKISKIRAA